MTGTYTRSPWEWLVQHGTGLKKGLYSPGGLVLRPEENGNNSWLIVNEADARLIAAAPELLEALKNAVPFLEEIARSYHEDWMPEMALEDSVLGKAYAAIAKVERRQ